MPSIEISLYECGNARVSGDKIYCSKGHILDTRVKDGMVNIQRLVRGSKLIFKSCKGCEDLDCMGKPIPKKERGWIERRN